MMELPPRARRILAMETMRTDNPGTTSACAENTDTVQTPVSGLGNYLRVRGEYEKIKDNIHTLKELPPRARRIHRANNHTPHQPGTTSACAENTRRYWLRSGPARNYLRVRGEYRNAWLRTSAVWELPPRARRIRHCYVNHPPRSRTTSACAENTRHKGWGRPGGRNYLRVRGEYHHDRSTGRCRRGTTSACAENTLNELGLL